MSLFDIHIFQGDAATRKLIEDCFGEMNFQFYDNDTKCALFADENDAIEFSFRYGTEVREIDGVFHCKQPQAWRHGH